MLLPSLITAKKIWQTKQKVIAGIEIKKGKNAGRKDKHTCCRFRLYMAFAI